ncbi:6-bladed beta-propeller [Chitinophaga sp. GCM10012297]|uniref:6-bladed beta-propeller n=1 Tax=Chitinophaga chungangae TaxID=2821488 RepID=A0ABS3YBY1_9BACT|nr:6-bladed beta-propeller [Chitinophaga chungangae]MBO9152193.1 6-bladed beta-propeller [Chitinophaga chungangae]
MNSRIIRRLFSQVVGLAFLIVTPAYAQNIVQIDTSSFTAIRIDPSNAMGGNVSDIFSGLEYIPLETTPKSTLGKVNQLGILNGHFVVLDYDKNAIFIFEDNGKFRARINGKKGIGIQRFYINRWTNQIVFSNDNFQSMNYCDLDGKVVRTDRNMDLSGIPIIYLNTSFTSKDQLIGYDQYRDLDTLSIYYKPYSRSLLRFGHPIHSIGMPYTAAESKIDVLSTAVSPLKPTADDTVFLFTKPYDYLVYSITPSSIALAYKFIFPQSFSLPDDFLVNRIYEQKRIAFVQKNKSLIFSLNNFYKLGHNLLFRASAYTSSMEDNLIYNLASGSLIAYKRILPDEMSFFLPICDKVTSNFENIGIAYSDGTYIYTSLSSLSLFNGKEEAKDKKVAYPETLKRYFNKSTSTSNPVILRLKLKEEL